VARSQFKTSTEGNVLSRLLVALALAWTSLHAQAVPPSTTQPVNAVIEWNRTLLTIVRTPGAQPATIHSTRSYAILHGAILGAVNSADRRFDPYFVQPSHIARHASPTAAAHQAAHDVLVALYPTFQTTLDTELQQDLDQIPDGKSKTDGIAIGKTAAAQILAARSNDGSAVVPPPFVAGTQPGDYQITPPNFPAPVLRQWPDVTPFVISRGDRFRPVPPPTLTSLQYAQAFNEVKSLGFAGSTTRTAEQTTIGRFWGGSIQNFWNEIAQTAALGRHLDLRQTARLFAVLNFTLADTAIAFYDAKYFYSFWRPVTAVRSADDDGNPDTAADPTWLPLSTNTAPDPSYPGAHSAVSAAGAEILRDLLGDKFNFDVTSESLPGVTRHFTSFTSAAQEAGLSRIYAGQHFRFDHDAGRFLGQRVAISVLVRVFLHR
jgi:membrane-associated phospholipid phosphatase